jgi:hypothetical protein
MMFQELNINKFDTAGLSEYNLYLLVTPITVYMWIGLKVVEEIKSSSLSVLKAFF